MNAESNDNRVRVEWVTGQAHFPGREPSSETDVDQQRRFKAQVCGELQRIGRMLIEKNQAYGNSALDPVRVFSRADPVEQIKVRIDDKLSRLQRGSEFGEDTITDLIGYLVLLKIAAADRG